MARLSSALLSVLLWCALMKPGHGAPTKGSSRSGAEMIRKDWAKSGQQELQHALASSAIKEGVAKNVILFIGDGMGPSTITSARVYNAQSRGLDYHEANLAFEEFPHTAITKTYNTDRHVPDSAGTATAFLCGEKARVGIIGLGQDALRGDCKSAQGQEVKSILKYAQDEGKSTGVVTTTRITHATPSAAYAHSPERDWESDKDIPESQRGLGCTDIAAQLVDSEYGKNIRVILGGGRRSFLPNDLPDPEGGSRGSGRRLDGRDLTKEWLQDKISRGYNASYVMDRTTFENVRAEETDFLMGLFESSHMQFETDRSDENIEAWGEPSLTEMTEKAIRLLSKQSEGYFLLVEGGRIDHAHHDNWAMRALNETVAFSDAVRKAVELTSADDTLIAVTADHSHVFTMSGYATIGTDILGIVDNKLANDGLPFTTVNYANGPGWDYHRGQGGRRDVSLDRIMKTLGKPTYRYDAAVPLNSETHGGEDITVYARGPMSHLFHGVRQQNFITHALMFASCTGTNQELCNKGS